MKIHHFNRDKRDSHSNTDLGVPGDLDFSALRGVLLGGFMTGVLPGVFPECFPTGELVGDMPDFLLRLKRRKMKTTPFIHP